MSRYDFPIPCIYNRYNNIIFFIIILLRNAHHSNTYLSSQKLSSVHKTGSGIEGTTDDNHGRYKLPRHCGEEMMDWLTTTVCRCGVLCMRLLLFFYFCCCFLLYWFSPSCLSVVWTSCERRRKEDRTNEELQATSSTSKRVTKDKKDGRRRPSQKNKICVLRLEYNTTRKSLEQEMRIINS